MLFGVAPSHCFTQIKYFKRYFESDFYVRTRSHFKSGANVFMLHSMGMSPYNDYRQGAVSGLKPIRTYVVVDK